MSEKSKARKVQAETGLSYQQALNLVRGHPRFRPASPSCIFRSALELARARVPEPTDSDPECTCPRCDP
jgi:hypothetical protein